MTPLCFCRTELVSILGEARGFGGGRTDDALPGTPICVTTTGIEGPSIEPHSSGWCLDFVSESGPKASGLVGRNHWVNKNQFLLKTLETLKTETKSCGTGPEFLGFWCMVTNVKHFTDNVFVSWYKPDTFGETGHPQKWHPLVLLSFPDTSGLGGWETMSRWAFSFCTNRSKPTAAPPLVSAAETCPRWIANSDTPGTWT